MVKIIKDDQRISSLVRSFMNDGLKRNSYCFLQDAINEGCSRDEANSLLLRCYMGMFVSFSWSAMSHQPDDPSKASEQIVGYMNQMIAQISSDIEIENAPVIEETKKENTNVRQVD